MEREFCIEWFHRKQIPRCDRCKRQITTEHSWLDRGERVSECTVGLQREPQCTWGKITVFNPHYLKLSYSNEENHIIHFANDL